jgi:hypothetical protein
MSQRAAELLKDVLNLPDDERASFTEELAVHHGDSREDRIEQVAEVRGDERRWEGSGRAVAFAKRCGWAPTACCPATRKR